MRFARFGIAQWAAPLLIWLTSGSALAAAPSNDLFNGAKLIAVPFSEVLDTTEATTDGDDAQLNGTCDSPFEHTDASVWYVIQGTDHDFDVAVDARDSNYSTAVLVGTGSQGNLQAVNCREGALSFTVAAGTTYYILVADDQLDGGGNGGLLNVSFSFTTIPRTPTIDISVDKSGTVDVHNGVARIFMTYTCTNADHISVSVDVSQDIGRLRITGSAVLFESGTCDGAPHPLSSDFLSTGGRFGGGKLETRTDAFACNTDQCAEEFVDQTVQLHGGPK